jgi:hypothetical protein
MPKKTKDQGNERSESEDPSGDFVILDSENNRNGQVTFPAVWTSL